MLENKNAQGGTRTRTGVTTQGILSPLCLPIPPPEPIEKKTSLIFFKIIPQGFQSSSVSEEAEASSSISIILSSISSLSSNILEG